MEEERDDLPISIWDVIPLHLKLKNRRRVDELQRGLDGGNLPYYELNERCYRGSLRLMFSQYDANKHEGGLEAVDALQRNLRAAASVRRGMPEHEGFQRFRGELEEMRSTIIHHRDHRPGPWMQGYVYPESTGVSTGDQELLEEE
jgi:hypothetical protein